MKEVVIIIHFQPIELYPPVLNLIKFIADKKLLATTYVLTTKTPNRQIDQFTVNHKHIKILRYGRIKENASGLNRTLNYVWFYGACLLHLLFKRPNKLFYIETLSSLPVYLYMRYINKKVTVFVHYHEYTSAAEYKSGMTLSRVFHKYEKYILSRATWVSHTNEERMARFKSDILPVQINKAYVLPNYPPLEWSCDDETNLKRSLKSIIYVGALGMDSMYLREFAEWVEAQNGRVNWDIYSQQNGDVLVSYLSAIKSRYIQFKGRLNYFDLPSVLCKYSIGVILYKGHIPNYIYNAPNKLFEYLACGLDVWFPVQMEGSKPYVTHGVFPKVVALDFDNLDTEINEEVFLHRNMTYVKPIYYCENVLPSLIQQLYINAG